MQTENIFTAIPENLESEVFQTLWQTNSFRLERIISHGQSMAEDEWYDQDEDEWVLVLKGQAKLHFEGKAEEVLLLPGDYIFLPAHVRHRVAWTDPDDVTIWLTLFFQEQE
jgi:cupin 2 domain-containing protein